MKKKFDFFMLNYYILNHNKQFQKKLSFFITNNTKIIFLFKISNKKKPKKKVIDIKFLFSIIKLII